MIRAGNYCDWQTHRAWPPLSLEMLYGRIPTEEREVGLTKIPLQIRTLLYINSLWLVTPYDILVVCWLTAPNHEPVLLLSLHPVLNLPACHIVWVVFGIIGLDGGSKIIIVNPSKPVIQCEIRIKIQISVLNGDNIFRERSVKLRPLLDWWRTSPGNHEMLMPGFFRSHNTNYKSCVGTWLPGEDQVQLSPSAWWEWSGLATISPSGTSFTLTPLSWPRHIVVQR